MEPNGFVMFVGALVAVYLVPGADMILVLQTGACAGRSRALATAAGLALARAGHVAFAGLGLAALFRTEPWTFDLARWVGAAYLLWLGIAVLRAEGAWAGLGRATEAVSARLTAVTAFRRGLATNILNPKALLFCSMLLPQFIHPDRGPAEAQFLWLGAVLVGLGFAFDAIFAGVGAGLGALMERRPRLAALQRGVFAMVLIGFAVRLAVALHQP